LDGEEDGETVLQQNHRATFYPYLVLMTSL